MELQKYALVPVGVCAGLLTTGLASTVSYLSTKTAAPWKTAPADWGHLMHNRVMHPVLGINRVVRGRVDPVAPGEFVIAIAEHPSTFGTPELCAFMGQALSSSISVVMRHDLPAYLRLPLTALDIGLPINREDRDQAIGAIQGHLGKFTARSTVLLLFPDGTRPTAAKRQKVANKWRVTIPDFDTWTLMPPKVGAFGTALDALDRPVRIIDITHGFDFRDEGWGDVWQLYGATYHVQVETFWSNTLPRSEEGRRQWLVDRWRLKNQRHRAWRQRQHS